MSFDPHKTKTRLILCIIAVFVIVSVFYFRLRLSDEPILTVVGQTELAKYLTSATGTKMTNGSASSASATSTATTTVATTVVAKGSYKTYSDTKTASSTDGSKVIFFFNASWSPKSEAIDSEISLSSIPARITVFSVDYDKYTNLRKQYSVTVPETFVEIDSSGSLVKKWSGVSFADIIKQIN